MKDFNEYTFVGFLGRDAEVRQIGNGTVLLFNVGISDDYINKEDGKKVERTLWVSCLKDIREDSQLPNYLKKGTKVLVKGVPTTKVITGKDGEPKANLNCRVDELYIMRLVYQNPEEVVF